MEEMNEQIPRDTMAQGFHWLQALVWGVFLSGVMFGLGFLAGSRWGEQRASETGSARVTRLMPPSVELLASGGDALPEEGSDSGGKVWGILTGGEKSSGAQEGQAPTRPKQQEGAPKVQVAKPSLSEQKEVSVLSSQPTVPSFQGPRPVSTKYSLQVISVQGREKAESIVRDLTSKGYPSPRVSPAELPGRGTWYRVKVGYFENKEEAEGWAKQLRDRERMQPQVVRDRD